MANDACTSSHHLSTLASTRDSSASPLNSDRNEDFIMGKWDVQLSDWRRLCVPYGCMACFCSFVVTTQVGACLDGYLSRRTRLSRFVDQACVALWIGVEIQNIIQGQPLSLILLVALVFILWVFNVAVDVARLRTKVRGRFDIPGSESDDWNKALCCYPCVVAQMATQVKTPSWSFSEPEILPAYIG